MLDNDYLKRRAEELGLERGPALERIQELLEQWYPGQCRAASLNQGVLRLVTPNASVAGELRLRQVELLAQIGPEPEIKRLQIQIG